MVLRRVGEKRKVSWLVLLLWMIKMCGGSHFRGATFWFTPVYNEATDTVEQVGQTIPWLNKLNKIRCEKRQFQDFPNKKTIFCPFLLYDTTKKN